MVDFRVGELRRTLREVSVGVGAEHFERNADARQVAVVLVARIGIRADRIAEIVERRGGHHRVEVDGAEHLALFVEQDVVDLRVVVRHAGRDRTVLDLRPEREHLGAPRLDPADLPREVHFAPCGIAGQGGVPLSETVADVMEPFDRLRQRFGEIVQLGLEFPDAFAALAGQFRGVGLVVGNRVVDEDRCGPVFAFRVDVVQVPVLCRDDGHHLAPRVASGRNDAAADVFRDPADVVHHGRHVGENGLVLALEDVVGGICFGADDECVVDESFAQ